MTEFKNGQKAEVKYTGTVVNPVTYNNKINIEGERGK
jgi:hypothetical protein